MTKCLEQAVPTMSINQEYKKIASEEDGNTEDKLLQGILRTQISSLKGIEKIEEKQAKEKAEENQKLAQETKQEEIATAPDRKARNTSNHKQSYSRKI